MEILRRSNHSCSLQLELLAALLMGAVLIGCGMPHRNAVPKGGPEATRFSEAFHRAVDDCRLVGVPPALISSGSSHYTLPISVDEVIKLGSDAVHPLETFTNSIDITKRTLAHICIHLIEAKYVERGTPRKDEKTGIPLLSYTTRN
jgi:hypothetical protein